jgi:hypothetical protein
MRSRCREGRNRAERTNKARGQAVRQVGGPAAIRTAPLRRSADAQAQQGQALASLPTQVGAVATGSAAIP